MHVKDLAGYTGYITNTAGSVVSTYAITSSDDVKTVNLNKGVYGFTAVKGTEKVQTMIYGDPANFELALFGNYTDEVFKETKAVEGMLTIIGEIMAGGNVIVDSGFVIVSLASN